MGQLSNVQIGTFVLSTELLVYLVAGMMGVLAVRIRQRLHPEREWLISVAWNAVFLWVVIWKASLLLFDLKSVIDNPMSLLFFSGGVRGLLLASAIVIAYIGFRYVRKLGNAEGAALTATMLSGWVATVCLAQIVLSNSVGFMTYLFLFISILLLILLLKPARSTGWSLRYMARVLGVLLIVTMIGYTVFDYGNTKTIGHDQAAPDFQLTDLEGNVVNLSDYRGQTVLMNFWATWCQVCKAEMPHVEKLYQNYKDLDVVVLSVNVTSQERNAQQVESYVDKHGLSFPVVLDEQGTVAKQYQVTAYPTTYVIDSTGKIRNHYLGAISYENMKKVIQNIG
ncbi:TlpA family protein disulfide reductase [Cohnella abietis]|uniref:Thioredoxin domain-containing protein n=1 Tax=Cohnella abietis TaxID=2507935 RepID=A0A3T1DEL8_9BACL|nr:redoxin domain-containing protein [Cohnella abietis]BBI36418.1 hypothetical protein KCTCHS21_58170 [Cohnella abietis]